MLQIDSGHLGGFGGRRAIGLEIDDQEFFRGHYQPVNDARNRLGPDQPGNRRFGSGTGSEQRRKFRMADYAQHLRRQQVLLLRRQIVKWTRQIAPQGRVALVRQYRHPLGTELLELPAGTLDVAGESPEDAAHRELAEEVGLATDDLIALGGLWNSAGWSDERTELFLARRTRPAPAPAGFAAADEEAVMTVEWRPLDALVRAALDGELEDAKTVVGVLRARAVLDAGPGRATV